MKIQDIASEEKSIWPTSIAGLYVRDVEFGVVQALQELSDSNNPMDTVEHLFKHVICDENGKQFEDVDRDSIASFGVMRVNRIVKAASEALDISGNGSLKTEEDN